MSDDPTPDRLSTSAASTSSSKASAGRILLPPGVKTQTALPRLAATFCLLCCLTVAVMGTARLRSTTEVYRSVLNPLLFFGEGTWKVVSAEGECLAKLQSIVTSAEGRYRVYAQFVLPERPRSQLVVELVFSNYRLLEGIHIDASFGDEIVSMNSKDGGLTLGYRQLILPTGGVASGKNLMKLAKKDSGSLFIPQPILLIDDGSNDSFRLSFPPILNRYLASDRESPIEIVPAEDEECRGRPGSSDTLRSRIHEAITQFKQPEE